MRRLLVVMLVLWASPSWGAAIGHTFVEQNTIQTTTSNTFGDVSGMSITSGNFTVGKKYLLVLTYQADETGSSVGEVRLVHGSTEFDGTKGVFQRSSGTFAIPAGSFTVWTAVSSEDVKVQFRSVSAGQTTRIDQVALLAINLSDDVTENTDWCFAESTADQALSTTPVDGASCTITPGVASHDWVVMSYSLIDADVAGTASAITRMERSGEASSSLPSARSEFFGTLQVQPFMLTRAFNLGASSNTFKEVSEATATNHTRLHSAIFMLDLDKFRNHTVAYTEADINLSATAYATELQTLSITPSVAGDVWIIGYWGADRGADTREVQTRIQVDGSDQPSGQTTDAYTFELGDGATDEYAMIQHTMVISMTAAAHTVDLDGSADSVTSSPTGQHRALIAVTMELASAAASRRPISPIIFH